MSSSIRVGVDIVPLSRAITLIESEDGLLTRFLLTSEVTEALRNQRIDTLSIAGKLAAKEAIFKLFRQPGCVVPWLGIEIRTCNCGGWPSAVLTGRAAQLAAAARLRNLDISITHDGDYAIAVAAATVVRQCSRLQEGS